MSLEKITEGLRERAGEDSGLGAILKFDFADDGIVLLDASQVPNVITNEDGEAQCTMKITMEDFIAMTEGELDGMTAFMTGKLKIEGDMGIAMKLQSLLKG